MLAITGASGYIGSHLLDILDAQNLEYLLLSRERPLESGLRWRYFDFESEDNFTLSNDVTALVHMACGANSRNYTPNLELSRTRQMLNYAKSKKIRFIYLSSQSAHASKKSIYAESKKEIESLVLQKEGEVIRPGFVFGGRKAGLYGSLLRITLTQPLIPKFVPSPSIDIIDVHDLCGSIVNILELPARKEREVAVGLNFPLGFNSFLRAISSDAGRKVFLPLPIPIFAVRFFNIALGTKLSDKAGLSRIMALHSTPSIPKADFAKNKSFLTLSRTECFIQRHDASQRRKLLFEAKWLCGYILDELPPIHILKTYARSVEASERSVSIYMPSFMRTNLALMLVDASPKLMPASKMLSAKLQFASIICEASTSGARKFIGSTKRQCPIKAITILFVGTSKAVLTSILGATVGIFLQLFLSND